MTPKPLSVDPDQLGLAGGQLAASAAQLPAAPPPFMPVGSDPLSAAIIAQIPAIEGPITTQLPAVQAEATRTATNVVSAAHAYASTDQQLGGQIAQEMQNLPDAPNAGSGGAGSMSQMMSMPMQMAGQLAQIPMQLASAGAAMPQGAVQGVQQVGQQVQQMAGQFGAGPGDVKGGERYSGQDGAAAGEPGAERAPDTEAKSAESDEVEELRKAQESENNSGDRSPGRHRRPDAGDPIDL